MFKYDGDSEYRAAIELPNDGTPHSSRLLEMQVYPDDAGNLTLDIGIRYPELGKFKFIVRSVEINVEQASELLYPVARIKTIKVLEPTGK